MRTRSCSAFGTGQRTKRWMAARESDAVWAAPAADRFDVWAGWGYRIG